jgi:FKBP-type peptidyl-prolyl cis-trans isomerase FkpA
MPPIRKPLIVVALTLALVACNSEDDCLRGSLSIPEYLEENDLSADRLESGLQYIIEAPGDTVQPTLSDTVTVEFVGYTTDQDTFDMTIGEPRTLLMNNLIPGWEEGIALIGQGGRISLFVPANLGYDINSVGPLCGNTDLIFDIDLLEVR